MHSTPITEMEKLTAKRPLSQQREHYSSRKVQVSTRLPHERETEQAHKEQIENVSSSVHVNKKLIRKFQEQLPKDTLPIYPSDMLELWLSDHPDIKVFITVPYLTLRRHTR